MYTQTSKNKIITSNEIIIADGFSSITIKNIGTDDIRVNDNILIHTNESYVVNNRPDVLISENTSIIFNSNNAPKALIIKYYNNLKN